MKLHRIAMFTGLVAVLGTDASAQTVGIGVNPQGSLFYRTGSAVAKTMNEKMGIKARTQPFSGSSTFVPLLNKNEIQMAMVAVGDAISAFIGRDYFAGRPQGNIRLLNVMFELPFGVVVPADSPVQKVSELKGLRMPSGFPSMTTTIRPHNAYLASAGLSLDDMKPFPVANVFKGVLALGDGKVDASGAAPGIAFVQKAHIKLKKRGGVRFLPLDTSPKAIASMKRVLPSRVVVVKPAKHLVGVLKPTPMMAYSIYLAANAAMSDDLAYSIVKTLHANKPHLVRSAKVLNRFKPDRMTEKLNTPYHSGAIRFYKEVGQWPPKG